MIIHANHIKADFKQIVRDPILVFFLIIPMFIIIVFKLFIFFLVPNIRVWTGFDLAPWYGYVLAVIFCMCPEILGAVTGFLMIDNRDENIYSLMAVTPLGYSGYMFNRLIIPFFISIAYTFLGYGIMNIYFVDTLKLLYIALLTGLEGITVSLMFFMLADDKVQGLTWAKGLSVITLFAFADLLNLDWVSAISGLIPFYWPSRLIRYPATMTSVILSLAVHLLWIGLLLLNHRKRV